MLLRTTAGERPLTVQRRSDPFTLGSRIPPWSAFGGLSQWSGVPVNRETSAGIPAVGAAIRLVAETIGMIPLVVYEGDPLERQRARDSWQWELLHDQPNEEQSAFDFFQDVASSIESSSDAYIMKIKLDRGRVNQLIVLDPGLVSVRRDDNNRKVFDVDLTRGNVTRKETFTSSTILHVRGWSLAPGADEGTSPIALYRNSLGSHLALHEFEGRTFKNNARPGGVIEIPADLPRSKLEQARELWEETHRGVENTNRIGVLAHGAKYHETQLSMSDLQFVESKSFTISEVARMFRITPSMLGAVIQGQRPTVTEDFERFLKVDLAPRLRRIEMAFRNDPDLFPDRELFPEFLADMILRPDIKTRYEAYRLARQGGWLKANEIRERENLPPAEGGDEIQETPVGGAANQQAAPSGDGEE